MNQTTATKSKPGRGRHLVAHRLLAVLLLLLTLWGQSAFAGPNMLYGHHTTKPGRGVQVDWSNPMARGLKVLVLFNENGGPPFMVVPQRPVASSVNAPSWTSNGAGIARNYSATNMYDVLDTETNLGLPTARVTVAVIRRKQDATLRGTTFVVDSSGLSDRLNAHLPFSDGLVYWDFGGDTAPNRLTWSGYSVTTDVERWTVVAGKSGSTIYLNALSRATQSTAITRTVSNARNFNLNQWPLVGIAGDIQELNYFGLWDAEWTPTMVAWWTADPYPFLLQPNVRRWGIPVGTGPSGGLLLFGVGR